jgi:hypothetical protein
MEYGAMFTYGVEGVDTVSAVTITNFKDDAWVVLHGSRLNKIGEPKAGTVVVQCISATPDPALPKTEGARRAVYAEGGSQLVMHGWFVSGLCKGRVAVRLNTIANVHNYKDTSEAVSSDDYFYVEAQSVVDVTKQCLKPASFAANIPCNDASIMPVHSFSSGDSAQCSFNFEANPVPVESFF